MLALLKAAFLAALVAAYWLPHELIQLAGEEGSDVQVQVVRFILTVLTIWMSMLSATRFWLSALVALVQATCWGLFITKERDHEQVGEAVEAEKQLYQLGAVACFALLWVFVLFGGGNSAQERFRTRLTAFYTKHNPDKLSDVAALVKKYEGNEDLLFARLHRKYNSLSADVPASKAAAIDEGEFLYEQSEDEAAHEADNEADSESDSRAPAEASSGDSEVDDGFQVVKPPVSARVASPVGTPPVSPRSTAALAHSRRQTSTLIQDAIAEARRAQEERVKERIARLMSGKQPSGAQLA